MTEPVDLSVSIVSTNERHYIEKLLPTLYDSGEGISMEVILIDNHSGDRLEEIVNEGYPNLHIIRNSKKLGFCANHNIGIENSHGRYVLVLNPDILFEKGEQCLVKMVQFMDGNPSCGVSGCREYNFQKNFAYPARRFLNLRTILVRRLPKFFYSEKVMCSYFYKDLDIKSSFECDWLHGCFLFFRRQTIEQIGGFDTAYKKYFEDVDVCNRAHKAGWDVLYNGNTYYYHLEQRASKKLFSKDAILHIRSYLRWIFRHNG